MGRKSSLDRDVVLQAIEKHGGNISKAATELGVPRSTLSGRYRSIIKEMGTSQSSAASEDEALERISISEKEECVDFICLMRSKTPANKIAEQAGYDPKLWKVTNVSINQWEVAGKRSLGQDKESKAWLGEELWKKPLFQIKFKLERRAPKYVQDGIEHLMRGWKNPTDTPSVSRRSTQTDPHLLEISLFDVHFGKLAWADETGSDYNLKIAEEVYINAVSDLLERSKSFNVERIVFPIGQDFFNVDNWKGETANGTLVESTDDRFSKVFSSGVEAVKWAILECRNIAPVHVLWSPGNHDRSTSWYLCKTLEQYCIGSMVDDITFDLKPNQRKYELFGNTLIGFTHGCDEKIADLPLTMAREEKQLWAQADYHVWHVGHFHKKKEARFIAGDTFNGVSVNVLPSLCATDSYHYRNGWVKGNRCAESYLWSKTRGLSSFMVHNI